MQDTKEHLLPSCAERRLRETKQKGRFVLPAGCARLRFWTRWQSLPCANVTAAVDTGHARLCHHDHNELRETKQKEQFVLPAGCARLILRTRWQSLACVLAKSGRDFLAVPPPRATMLPATNASTVVAAGSAWTNEPLNAGSRALPNLQLTARAKERERDRKGSHFPSAALLPTRVIHSNSAMLFHDDRPWMCHEP